MSCIDVTLPLYKADRPLLLVVAAALLDDQGRVLLTERPPQKSMAGLWEFPGGKVAPLETPEAALVRELDEELGIKTSIGCLWPFTFASHAYKDFHLLMPVFFCRMWQGTPRAQENQKLAWFKKEELRNLPMPPADIPLVSALFDWMGQGH